MVLPALAELRQRAEEEGIDPKPFGRKRRALFEAIEQRVLSRPFPKMVRTATSVSAPVEVTLDEKGQIVFPPPR